MVVPKQHHFSAYAFVEHIAEPAAAQVVAVGEYEVGIRIVVIIVRRPTCPKRRIGHSKIGGGIEQLVDEIGGRHLQAILNLLQGGAKTQSAV
jgi:hypothetical protein